MGQAAFAVAKAVLPCCCVATGVQLLWGGFRGQLRSGYGGVQDALADSLAFASALDGWVDGQ